MRARRDAGSFDLGISCALLLIIAGIATLWALGEYRGVTLPLWGKIAAAVGALVILGIGMQRDSSARWPERKREPYSWREDKKPAPPAEGPGPTAGEKPPEL